MKERHTHTHTLAQTNKPAHATLMVGIDWLIERGTEGMERERERKRVKERQRQRGLQSVQREREREEERPQVVRAAQTGTLHQNTKQDTSLRFTWAVSSEVMLTDMYVNTDAAAQPFAFLTPHTQVHHLVFKG